MELRFEDQSTSRFAVYDVENEAGLDKLTLGMLTNNKIKGFARTGFLQVDSSKCLRYEISGLEPLTEIMQKSMKEEELTTLLGSLCDAFISADDYMIDHSFIYADKDSVFVNEQTLEASMLCIPDEVCRNQRGAASFFKSIVSDIRPADSEAERFAAKLLSCVNNPNFSVASLNSLLFDASRKEADIDRDDDGALVDDTSYTAGSSAYGGISSGTASGYSQWNEGGTTAGQIDDDEEEDDSESISFMYLMQHYNKENAALYKAQKEKKKGKIGEEKAKKSGKKRKESDVDLGFVVPGGQIVPAQDDNDGAEERSLRKKASAGRSSEKEAQTETRRKASFGLDRKKKKEDHAVDHVSETAKVSEAKSDTVLSGQDDPRLKPRAIALVHLRTGLKMRLTDVPIDIGRDPQHNQFLISDNILIGRLPHATVYIQNGQAYVKDNKSTNHTFINGAMLPPYVPQPIKIGQIFTLANEHFMLQYIED